MAHKSVGGWLIPGKLYLKAKIANELWYYRKNDEAGTKQVHLFFVGWYEAGGPARLFSVTILWVSFQVGFVFKDQHTT